MSQKDILILFRKFKNMKKQLPYSFLIYVLSEEMSGRPR